MPANRLLTIGVKRATITVMMVRPTANASPSAPARLATGPPPIPRARRAAMARPTSCSSGKKIPGASTNTKTQSAFSAA